MNITSSEIAHILDLKQIHLVSENMLFYISIDSRYILDYDKTVFIAIDGSKSSGVDYILDLIQKGVRNFILSEKYVSRFKVIEANFFYVKDPLRALQKIVSQKRKEYQVPVIGITGSNGKTIVKEWLAQILQDDYQISKSPKSYNSQLGVPLSVWGLDESHQLGIYEAGISMPNEMISLEQMIRPNIGVLTHLGDAHQSNFTSMEDKLNEKLKLFIHSDCLIVKRSLYLSYRFTFDAFLEKYPTLKITTWGSQKDSDIYISEPSMDHRLSVSFQKNQYGIQLQSVESSYLDNISHCIAVIFVLNRPLDKYIPKIEQISSVEMRLEVVKGQRDMMIINDSYNADMDSLMIAVKFLLEQDQNTPKSIILSEIAQTGEFPIDMIYHILKAKSLHQLVLLGSSFESHIAQFQSLSVDQVSYYPDTDYFLKYHDHGSLRGHFVLIKGARKYHLEDIVQFYREKTHSTYLKIHLNALKNNLTAFAQCVRPETKIMVMLKAQGYGLGSIALARLFETGRVDYFAMAYIDEGIELRKAGIQKSIMVLNSEPNALEQMITYRLEPEIYSMDILKQFVQIVSQTLKEESTVYIHVKLETGMNRLGLNESDIFPFLQMLSNHKQIRVQSVFSHLAASDDEDLDSFTKLQITRFDKMYAAFVSHLGYHPMRHILNTGGILRHSEHQYEMVRLGIGLFGFDSTHRIQSRLENTITFISKIAQIKQVSKEETIGYSRNGKLSRDTTIAIINVGYADGYSRKFGNGRASVFVKNQFAPTIGNICMDMIMVDITDCKNIMVGDEVELMGNQIPISKMAAIAETIPYEIITSISSRVQRVYWED